MTLLGLAMRSVLRGWRVLAVAALPALIGLVAVLLRARTSGPERVGPYGTLVGELLLPIVVALAALVLGVNAFGDERDEQTLALLLATTAPRWQLVLTKYAAALVLTLAVSLPAMLGCLLLAGATPLSMRTVLWSLPLATALAAAAYLGLFLLLSLLLRRALVVGLAYLVLWEQLLAGLTTFKNASIGAHAAKIGAAPFTEAPVRVADVSTPVAALVLVLVPVLALAAASWRLARTQV